MYIPPFLYNYIKSFCNDIYSSLAGGSAGGAVMISAQYVTINGNLTANGGTGAVAGGSGGSILIFAAVFSGTGLITANGGTGVQLAITGCTGYGGGGAGGRIAIHYNSTAFTGSLTAYGGTGYNGNNGGPGTVYLNDIVAQYDKIIVSNNKYSMLSNTLSAVNTTMGSVAWITDNSDSFVIDEVNLSGSAGFAVNPSGTVSPPHTHTHTYFLI